MKVQSYQDIIKKYADNEMDVPISNLDANHAAIIIKNLFYKATSEVCIFTGSLFSDVYGKDELVNEAIKFLKKPNTKLKIAIQEETFDKSFLEKIKSSALEGQISVYNAGKKFASISNHFCIADKKAFRYELDHKTREATANFGDKETAKSLYDVFELIINNSEPVIV